MRETATMEAPPETADSFLGIIGRDALRVTLKEVRRHTIHFARD